MVGFEFHFHAMREEIIEFVVHCIKKYNVKVFIMKFNPFYAELIDEEDIIKLKKNDSDYSFAMFTMLEPKWGINSQFPDEYVDKLYLYLPRLNNNKLEQISFGLKVSSDTDYPSDSLAVWKNMAKDLKKLTKPGVSLYYPKTGKITEKKKIFRYTQGAKEAYKRGILLTFPNSGPIGKIEE